MPPLFENSPQASVSARGSAVASILGGTWSAKLTGTRKLDNGNSRCCYTCGCCPKRPNKFGTVQELNAHVANKRYGCSICGSHFKNKNEAKRHRSSVHVRRQSWSCSALIAPHCAFHESIERPGDADTCCYCCEEFIRSGHPDSSLKFGGSIQPMHATDSDWEQRIRQLQEVHRFRECKFTKRFYRADHFRQHLKHSHAGTYGKWMRMLENMCSDRI